MGYDLNGAGGDFRFSVDGWRNVLRLAQLYGWTPAGTRCNVAYTRARCGDDAALADKIIAEWDGDYLANSYEQVTKEDAAAITDALERALPDVPHHETGTRKSNMHTSPESVLAAMSDWGNRDLSVGTTPLVWFAGDVRQKLIDFIAYCRAGGFAVG